MRKLLVASVLLTGLTGFSLTQAHAEILPLSQQNLQSHDITIDVNHRHYRKQSAMPSYRKHRYHRYYSNRHDRFYEPDRDDSNKFNTHFY